MQFLQHWQPAFRRLLIVLAIIVPGLIPTTARASTPTLLLFPERGAFRDCDHQYPAVPMAIGYDFPEGLGVATWALRNEGGPLNQGNVATLLGTNVVRQGRFVEGYLGLASLLCPREITSPDGTRTQQLPYPDGTRITVVAADIRAFNADTVGDAPILASATFTVDSQQPFTPQRCFATTLLCTRDRFYDYWLATGGLARHGAPLTAERRDVLEDGHEYTVQYFERSRLELHLENAAPYDVQLGQFGRTILATVPDAPSASVPAQPNQQYFAETGHHVPPDFAEYWQANGGLTQFGYPLSEIFSQQLEDGQTYEVQYFERARFERHPENQAPYTILLGQFGRQILAAWPYPPPPIPRTTDPPFPSDRPQVGVPAITPTIASPAPGQPAYTENDARDYANAHQLGLGKLMTTGPYQVERVTFLTNREAQEQHGITFGGPADRLLCMVTVRGHFTLTAPPVPNQTPTVYTFKTVLLFFDGVSGNLLGNMARPE